MSSVVVFPAPLGPSRPKISPFSIARFRPSTAVRLPNLCVRSWISIAGMALQFRIRGGSFGGKKERIGPEVLPRKSR